MPGISWDIDCTSLADVNICNIVPHAVDVCYAANTYSFVNQYGGNSERNRV